MREQPQGIGEFSIGGELWPGLSKLIEEAGEVVQVAGKLIGSEGRTGHWSGDLERALIEELGDVVAAVAFFVEANALDGTAIAERVGLKLATFFRWHRDTLATRKAPGGATPRAPGSPTSDTAAVAAAAVGDPTGSDLSPPVPSTGDVDL